MYKKIHSLVEDNIDLIVLFLDTRYGDNDGWDLPKKYLTDIRKIFKPYGIVGFTDYFEFYRNDVIIRIKITEIRRIKAIKDILR